jgi:hypothetical protein
MSKIVIEYDPILSYVGRQTIMYSVTPSMTSTDGTTSQYEITQCIEALQEQEMLDDMQVVISLMNDNVNFLEL